METSGGIGMSTICQLPDKRQVRLGAPLCERTSGKFQSYLPTPSHFPKGHFGQFESFPWIVNAEYSAFIREDLNVTHGEFRRVIQGYGLLPMWPGRGSPILLKQMRYPRSVLVQASL